MIFSLNSIVYFNIIINLVSCCITTKKPTHKKDLKDIHKINSPLPPAPRLKKNEREENSRRGLMLHLSHYWLLTRYFSSLYCKNHTVHSFVHGSFCPALYLWDASMLFHVKSLFSFMVLYRDSVHEHFRSSIFNPFYSWWTFGWHPVWRHHEYCWYKRPCGIQYVNRENMFTCFIEYMLR